MDKYTIYCTEEQTKRALKLGAPIMFHYDAVTRDDIPHFIDGTIGKEWTLYFIPTAEQMIGWLEEQEGIIAIETYRHCDYWGYGVIIPLTSYDATKHFSSRKEATLVAIDVALDYLEKR